MVPASSLKDENLDGICLRTMGFVKKYGALQEVVEGASQSASPRICMPTFRNFMGDVFRCGLYEAQDVLAEIDDVDLIRLDGDLSWGAWLRERRFREKRLRVPLVYGTLRKFMSSNPGLKKVELKRDYDVFIAVCNFYWELSYISAIERWKDHCKVSVCWIEELWAAEMPEYKYLHHVLSQFDYVFVGCRGSVSALSQAAKQPSHWLPGGIDALRFSPFPNPPARVIDVYSIGRRYKGIHRELSEGAKQGKLFYVHDTLANAGVAKVSDHQVHRDLFANMAKRSRYFVVAPAKMDSFNQTRGQVEIGSRYFEGAAAGAVMIGEVPDCDAYRELFGWPEAVIEVRPDGSDVMAVLSELSSDPERMAAIGRRNTKETLLRHDWVYRWNEMFRVAGIEPSLRMAARQRRLKDMGDFVAGANKNDATRDDV